MSLMRREQMDCCNYFEATGNEITIDSKSNWMQLESIEGNTTQLQTTGAQLFDISNPSSTINQWVITDKRISITNPTAGYLTVNYTIDVKPSTIYTIYSIIVNDIPDSNSMHITISILKEDGTVQDNIVILNNTSSATFTTTADTKSIYIYFRNRTTGNGGYFEDIVLNEGKTTIPWEPYTGGKPSPSPDYPQEIISANIKSVKIQGTQLFDIKQMQTVSNGGINYTIDKQTGVITIYDDIPTTTKELRIQYELSHAELINLFKKGNVFINLNTEQMKFNPYFIIQFFGNGVETKSYSLASINKLTFMLDETILDNELYNVRFILFAPINTNVIKGTMKPMVYQKGNGVYQPYYNPQTISLTFTESFRKVEDYADEITPTKTINRCIEITLDGSENWSASPFDKRFQLSRSLPVPMNKRAGFCNQYFVRTKRIENEPQVWLGINNNDFIYIYYNQFYDESLEDKGLSLWKAHLATNPLKIITYTNPEDYVETPLDQSNVDAIKSLYAYNGYTIVNNNENTNMKIMYKTKS